MTPWVIKPMEIIAKSPANSLTKEDYKKIARQVIIFFAPIWIVLLDQLEAWAFDYKILLALAVSLVFEAGRRFLREVK